MRGVSRLVLRVVVRLALCAHARPVEQVVSLSFGKPRRFPPIAIPCFTLRQPAHRWVAGVCRDLRSEAADEVRLTPLPTPWVGQVLLAFLPVPHSCAFVHSCAQLLTDVRYSSYTMAVGDRLLMVGLLGAYLVSLCFHYRGASTRILIAR